MVQQATSDLGMGIGLDMQYGATRQHEALQRAEMLRQMGRRR